MAGNRKKATDWLLKKLEEWVPGTGNVERTKQQLEAMTDKEFEDYVKAIEEGRSYVQVQFPNLENKKLQFKQNINFAKKIGLEFWQNIWIERNGLLIKHREKVPVYYMPVRRQKQHLTKKRGIAKHNSVVDAMTGQPTGDSAASRLSYPQAQVLNGQGMEKALLEFAKYRGGDQKGFQAMNDAIIKTGKVWQKDIEHLAGGVKSTKTLAAFLTAMHFKHNL